MRFFWLIMFLALFAVPAPAAEDTPTDAFEQYSLGGKYLTGEGVDQDEKKANILFRKAADQGLAIAQYYLSRDYADGRGVDRDNVEAFFWISLAAQGGDKFIVDYRDTLAQKMTPEQIYDIQKRVDAWKPTVAPPR